MIPSHFLRILQHKIIQFIWDKLKPCLPKPTLYSPRIRGRPGVLDFTKYYYAAHIEQLPKYHTTKETPLWVALESVDCDPLSTANLLWLTPAQRRTITIPISKHSLSIWDTLKTRFGLQSRHNPLLSVLHNTSFYPAWPSPTSFSTWSGLIQAHHFFKFSNINPFPTLCETNDLPSTETFRYLQIKKKKRVTTRPQTQRPLISLSLNKAVNL